MATPLSREMARDQLHREEPGVSTSRAVRSVASPVRKATRTEATASGRSSFKVFARLTAAADSSPRQTPRTMLLVASGYVSLVCSYALRMCQPRVTMHSERCTYARNDPSCIATTFAACRAGWMDAPSGECLRRRWTSSIGGISARSEADSFTHSSCKALWTAWINLDTSDPSLSASRSLSSASLGSREASPKKTTDRRVSMAGSARIFCSSRVGETSAFVHRRCVSAPFFLPD